MANYYQTDDRDDYFNSLDRSKRSPTTVSVIDPKGIMLFKSVQTWEVRQYYKDSYAKPGDNGKKVWRQKLTELGYTITKG